MLELLGGLLGPDTFAASFAVEDDRPVLCMEEQNNSVSLREIGKMHRISYVHRNQH